MERLQALYNEKIAPNLKQDLGLENVMEVPRIQKIVVNAGIGPFKDNKDNIDAFLEDMSLIAGQRPVIRKSRKSEAGFKIRKGEPVGVSVTLRGDRMWAFLDKLINVALPRVRDFSGVSGKAFDKSGNYSLGITEHTIFPEINPNTVRAIRSLQATIVTSQSDMTKSKALLTAMGMPFRKDTK